MGRPEQRVGKALWRRNDGTLVSPINTMIDARAKDLLAQLAFWQHKTETGVLEEIIFEAARRSKHPIVPRELQP